ncbi:MAG: hypothetical protein NUK57_08380 [Gudongella sp.]|nr:hypothetical protein [Gudongella sp.]
MKIINNKIFLMTVVMAMIISMGTVSFGEEVNPEGLIVEETIMEETTEPIMEEDPVMDLPQEDEVPLVEEESNATEETVQEIPEVEIVIEEPIDEAPVEEEIIDEIIVDIPEDVQLEEEAVEELPVIENTAPSPAMEEEAIPVEPLTPELEIVEPVFEEQIIPRYVSLRIGVEPSSERYTNGDLIRYEIRVENNGTDPIVDLDIIDDLAVNENIGHLDVGERATVTGTYRIDDYNRMGSIGNTVSFSAICDGERISGEVGFVVTVEIPQGSISISNSVNGRIYGSQDFIVLVEGPDSYINYVVLGDSDTVILRNLFIGEYWITPIACMNFSSSCSDEAISITTSNLDRDTSIEYSLENTGWFSDSYSQTINMMEVDTEDIDYGKMELQFSDVDIRSDEIYLDLEPLIVLVEVQVEALQQPEGEDSSSVADPVQEVTSEPVEAGLQEEVTEPDAAEGTEGLEPIATEETEPLVVEGTEEQGFTEEIDPVVPEELGGQEEMLDSTSEEPDPVTEEVEEIQLTNIEEPQAVIPDDPLVESNEEMETGEMDEGTEETDSETQPEEAVAPAESEEVPIDPV